MNLPDEKRVLRAVAVLIAFSTLLAAGPPQRPQPPDAPSPAVRKPAVSTQFRCAPASGEVIPAERVLDDLRDGKSVSLLGKIIEGNLDADSVFPEAGDRKASLRIIRGSLKLDSCRVTGRVALRHCVLLQEVSLICTEILGELDLADSEVRGAIKLDRARIGGDARLINTTVEGDLSLRGATLQGSLDLSGSRQHRVFLLEAELAGVTADHAVLHALDLTSARVSGGVRLSDVLALDSITARDATFGSGLFIKSARVAGSLQLTWASTTSEVSLTELSVDEDLFLPHLVEGATTLSDIAIGRNLVMENGLLQDMTIERLKVGGFTKMEDGRFSGKVVIADSDFGKTFNAKKSVFSGDCEFRKVLFPGDDPMAGVVFVHTPRLIDTKLLHDPAVKTQVPDDETDPSEDDDGP